MAGVPTTVGEVMTARVVTIAPQATVADAIDLFVKYSFRHLVVADGGRLVGVLSDRDALRQMARGRDAGSTAVADVMRGRPLVATPATALTEAAELLRAHRINCLPVVDAGGAVLGIVTTTDLLGTLTRVLAVVQSLSA
jgi:acetoin utilization protein AcuB